MYEILLYPGIQYGKQSVYSNNIKGHDTSKDKGTVKFQGFLKPPYDGWFNLMINGDDAATFKLYTGEGNATRENLVRNL